MHRAMLTYNSQDNADLVRQSSSQTIPHLSYAQTVSFNGTLLTFGGSIAGLGVSMLSNMVHFLPICTSTVGWTEVACGGTAPEPRRDHAMCVVPILSAPPGILFVHGGRNAMGNTLHRSYVLALGQQRRWHTVKLRSLEDAREGGGDTTTASEVGPCVHGHSAMYNSVRRCVWLAGGIDGKTKSLSQFMYEIQILNLSDATIKKVPNNVFQLSYCQTSVSSTHAIYYGGYIDAEALTRNFDVFVVPLSQGFNEGTGARVIRTNPPSACISESAGYPCTYSVEDNSLYVLTPGAAWKGMIPKTESTPTTEWIQCTPPEVFTVRKPSIVKSPKPFPDLLSVITLRVPGGVYCVYDEDVPSLQETNATSESESHQVLFHFDLQSSMWTCKAISARVNRLITKDQPQLRSPPKLRMPWKTERMTPMPPPAQSISFLPTLHSRNHTATTNTLAQSSPVQPLVPKLPGKVSTRQRRIERQIAINFQNSHAGPKANIFKEVEKSLATTSSVLDLHGNESLKAEDLRIVGWMVAKAPHIRTINISNTKINGEAGQVILDLLDETCTVTQIILEGCEVPSEAFTEAVAVKTARNASMISDHENKASARRELRAAERAARRERMIADIEMKHYQDRYSLELNALTKVVVLYQSEMRWSIGVELSSDYGALLIRMAQDEKRVIALMAHQQNQKAEREALEVTEESARRTEEKLEEKLRLMHKKEMTDAFRKLEEIRKEMEREQKQKRDAEELKEKNERTKWRNEEEEDFANLVKDRNASKRRILEAIALRERQIAEAEEKERRRQQEEKEKAEALKKAHQEWLEGQAKARENMGLAEDKERQAITTEEVQEQRTLDKSISDDKKRIELEERRALRKLTRDKCRLDPPTCTVADDIPERVFSLDSTAPIRLFLNPLTITSVASPPKYVKKILPMEANEITDETWVNQKLVMKGGHVKASFTEGTAEDVLYVQDKNGIWTKAGESAQLSLPPKPSLHDINQLIQSFGYHRVSSAPPEGSTVSVQIEFTFRFAVPVENPGDQDAFSESTCSTSIQIKFVPWILRLPMECRNLMYVEGTGFMPIFQDLQFTLPPPEEGVEDFFPHPSIVCELLTTDPHDAFAIEATRPTKKAPAKFMLEPLDEKEGRGYKVVTEAGTLATCEIPPSRKIVKIRFVHYDDPWEALDNVPHAATSWKLARGFTDVLKFCHGIGYRNECQNPVEGPRVLRLTLNLSAVLSCSVDVEVCLQAVDNPTIIEFGYPSIACRILPNIPEMSGHFPEGPIPLKFAGAAIVSDPDTDEFEGGFMTIGITSGVNNGDELRLDTISDNIVVLNAEDRSISVEGQVIGTLRPPSDADAPKGKPIALTVDFKQCRIAFIQHLLQRVVFVPGLKLGSRTVEVQLVVGTADVVRASLSIVVTNPLITTKPGTYQYQYNEGSDFIRFLSIITPIEDEDWMDGFLKFECVEGWTDDDRFKLYEDSEFVMKAHVPPATRKETVKNLKEADLIKNEGAAATQGVTPSSTGTNNGEGGVAKRSAADVKNLFRSKAKERVDQINEQKAKAHDAMRVKVLELVRTGPVVESGSSVISDITVLGDTIGTVTVQSSSLTFNFNKTTKGKHIKSILKHIGYKNVSANETVLKKVIRVLGATKFPHLVPCFVCVEIQTKDNATEFRKLNAADARVYRQRDESDLLGFTAFDDIECIDPDTDEFNGSVLMLEMGAGADLKGDQLGILSTEKQRKKGITDVIEVTDSTLSVDGVPFATYVVDAVAKDKASNLVVEFLEKASPPVSISLLQRVVHLITFTCISQKIKEGKRTVNLKFTLGSVESKAKFLIEVKAPLLWSPDYGSELKYNEGAAPLVLCPKAVVNANEKELIREGFLRVTLCEGVNPDDRIALDLSKSEFAMKDSDLYANKEYLGKLTVTPGESLVLAFDWASKNNAKHLQNIIRRITFGNVGNNPGSEVRKIEIALTTKAKDSPSVVGVKVKVMCKDDATTCTLPFPRFPYVRCSDPIEIFHEALVEDPDTDLFDTTSYIELELRPAVGVTPNSDVIQFHENHGLKLLPSGNIGEANATDTIVANIATSSLKDFPNLPPKFKISFVKCTLQQMQSMVRSLVYSTRAKDPKVVERTFILSIKTGTSPVTKVTAQVDMLTALVDVSPSTSSSSPSGALFTACTVSPGYFLKGSQVSATVLSDEGVLHTALTYATTTPDKRTITFATESKSTSFLQSGLLGIEFVRGEGMAPGGMMMVKVVITDIGRGVSQTEIVNF
eukprot:PhF_6_TR7856/c0_g1_i1/m.11463